MPGCGGCGWGIRGAVAPPNYANESSSAFFVWSPPRTRKRMAAVWDLPFAAASLRFTAAAFGRKPRRGPRDCALFSPYPRWPDRAPPIQICTDRFMRSVVAGMDWGVEEADGSMSGGAFISVNLGAGVGAGG